MTRSHIFYLFLLILGAFLYVPFLGGVHLFDWDEINFAESAREMIVSGDFLSVQIDFKAFWEKPPLFIWMQVLSMKLFGINEFAARFPNAIAGIITLLILFKVGRSWVNEKFAFIWAVIHGISFLPFLYFKSGIIDPWFNLFIFLGIYNFLMFYKRDNLAAGWGFWIKSALFIGLAVLTKGPVGLLIFLAVAGIYIILQRFRFKMNLYHVASWLFVFALTGGSWFLLLIWNGDAHIIGEFFEYQVRLFKTEDAGHGGFFLYHFVILLLGVFPASAFFIPAMFSKDNDNLNIQYYKIWMNILFWVVLVLFTIVKTKIVHYSSMCYFPLTFFAAVSIYKSLVLKIRIQKTIVFSLIAIAFVWALLLFIFPFIDLYKDAIIASNLIKDPFTVGNLMAKVTWTWMEPAVAIVFFVVSLMAALQINKNAKRSLIALLSASLFFIVFTILVVTPRIEGYSQRAAIDFFVSKNDASVYIKNLNYKSYAPLFYTKKTMGHSEISKDSLLFGHIEKDACFIFKNIHQESIFNTYPQLEKLYEKNGFVFAIRKCK